MAKKLPVRVAYSGERCAHISQLLREYEKRLVRHIGAQLKANGLPLGLGPGGSFVQRDAVSDSPEVVAPVSFLNPKAPSRPRLQLNGLREGRHPELFKGPIADLQLNQPRAIKPCGDIGAGKAGSHSSHMSFRSRGSSEPTKAANRKGPADPA